MNLLYWTWKRYFLSCKGRCTEIQGPMSIIFSTSPPLIQLLLNPAPLN